MRANFVDTVNEMVALILHEKNEITYVGADDEWRFDPTSTASESSTVKCPNNLKFAGGTVMHPGRWIKRNIGGGVGGGDATAYHSGDSALIPDGWQTQELGDNTSQLSSISSESFFGYVNQNDDEPAMALLANGLFFGPGGDDPTDSALRRTDTKVLTLDDGAFGGLVSVDVIAPIQVFNPGDAHPAAKLLAGSLRFGSGDADPDWSLDWQDVGIAIVPVDSYLRVAEAPVNGLDVVNKDYFDSNLGGATTDAAAWHKAGDTLAATGKIGATSGAYGFDLYASGARCGRILATGELIIGTGAAAEFSAPSNIAEFRRDQVDPTIVTVVNKDSSATSNAIAEFIAKNDSSDGSIRLSMTGTGWNSHSGVVAGEGVLWMYNANLVIATHDNYKIRWLLNSNDLGDMDPATGFFTWNNAIRAPIMKAYAETTTAYFEATDGVTAAVANANEGRFRYNNTTKTWQTSSDGGGWTSMLVGSGTAGNFTSWTSTGVLQNGNLKQSGGDILPITTGLSLGNYQEPFAGLDVTTIQMHAAPGDTRQAMFIGNDGTYWGINLGAGGSSLMDSRFARTGAKSLVFDDGAGGNLTVVAFKAGITVGAATGGAQGAGTINVHGDIYKDGAAYTNPDYVFEHWMTGKVEKFKDNEGAKEYVGRMTLDQVEAYCRKNLRLPGITDEGMGMFRRSDFILEKLEEIFTYLFDLKRDMSSRMAMAA